MACDLPPDRVDRTGEAPPIVTLVIDPRGLGPVGCRLGINVNYLMDDDARRPDAPPLASPLRRMGVRYLRYPGGEKSDNHLFAPPPFDRPEPVTARTGSSDWPSSSEAFMQADRRRFRVPVMDFDRFIALCREVDAEPIVVVCFDAMYRPAAVDGEAPTRDELVEHAAAWVRYANVERGYGVRYWEIGNESYMDSYNGGARAEEYGRDFAIFAKAMRAVDPTVLLGANGPEHAEAAGALDRKDGSTTAWWSTVLALAGGEIDWIALHSYPCWKWMSYDTYLGRDHRFDAPVSQGVRILEQWAPPDRREHVRILLTEMNATDYYGHPEQLGWPHVNDMGHALVLVDMLGSYLANRDLTAALLWNTRWIDNDDDAATPSVSDAIDRFNRLNPTGVAMAIWSEIDPEALTRLPPVDDVLAFVARRLNGELVLILLNKRPQERRVELRFPHQPTMTVTAARVWAADAPASLDPTWRREASMTDPARLQLPGTSVTVLHLE